MRILTTLLLLTCPYTLLAEEPIIDKIRQEYNATQQAMSSLTETNTDIDGYSTDGGHATVYRDRNKTIRLIKVDFYGESGKVHEEYYYRAGVLFFAFHQHHHYNVPYYVTPELAREIGSGVAFDPDKTIISEDRYYFHNGRMVRWLNDKKEKVNTRSVAFTQRQGEVLNFSTELLQQVQQVK